MTGKRNPAGGGFADRANHALADEVLERLGQIEAVAAGAPMTAAQVARARRELVRLVAAWRRLLEQHRADELGLCTRCRRWAGLRRAAWPCRFWIAAHQRLIDRAARLP